MANTFINVAKREFGKIFKKPVLLVIMFVVPLVICFILGETFKEGSPKNLPIAVLDQDNSSLSRKIARMVDATPTCEVKYHVTSLEEGRQLIVGGQTYALLVIPRDFTRDIYRGTYPKLVYYYNNQLLLIGGIITKDVTMAVQTVMVGVNAKIQMKKGLPKDVALSRINLIRVDEHVRSNPYLNYSYFLSLAAFVHTFQILIAFLAIWAVGIEFKEGTTKEWMETAGGSILTGIFGKLTPYILNFMIVSGLVYLIYFLGYGAPFKGSIIFLAFGTLLFILAYQLIGIMFVAITSNLRLSFSCGAFYTSLGFTFAGMTYPAIAMPAFAKFYSALLPLRPYISLLIDQSLREIPPVFDMVYIRWLILLALFGAAFLPLLKKHAQDEKQWYKI
ncbi:MAG: ABC transporter permease [Candidatus Gastranaerophilaceae bacterium]